MNALTLHQPTPTFAALGVVSILTMEEPADPEWIGQALALASSEEAPTEGEQVGDWFCTFRPTVAIPEVDVLSPGRWIVGHNDRDEAHLLPLGAVVASCRLAACVPMVDSTRHWPEMHALGIQRWLAVGPTGTDRQHGREATRLRLLSFDDMSLSVPLLDMVEVTDQLLYGDFTPGRWAWLLEDVKPTTERCPWCEGFGYGVNTPSKFLVPGDEPCVVCEGKGSCDPVSARGRQRLWRWTP